MTRIVLVGAVCLLIGAAVGSAQGSYTAYGHETDSCGVWTQDRKDTANDLASRTAQAWMLGFVSGVGFESKVPLSKTDAAGVRAWMDAYRAAHPLDTIAHAAGHLTDELLAKK